MSIENTIQSIRESLLCIGCWLEMTNESMEYIRNHFQGSLGIIPHDFGEHLIYLAGEHSIPLHYWSSVIYHLDLDEDLSSENFPVGTVFSDELDSTGMSFEKVHSDWYLGTNVPNQEDD